MNGGKILRFRVRYPANRRVCNCFKIGIGLCAVRLRRHIDTPVTWSRLHVICPDGTGDRALIDDVRRRYWISQTRLVVGTGPPFVMKLGRSQPLHLSEVDVVTGAVRRLTKGYFYHELCDVHDRKYLVLQRPVGGSEFQGNLWIIQP